MKSQFTFLRKPSKPVCAGAAGAVLALAAIVTLVAAPTSTPVAAAAPSSGAPAAIDATALSLSFRSVVQNALPAVVSISTTRAARVVSPMPFIPDGPFRRFFWGDPGFDSPREHERVGQGSGVVISEDGYILTNEHVVRDAEEITVAFHDTTERAAELVGADPKTDIAILKVDADDLASLSLGDSGAVEVGDLVLAMGNPFGIGATVTMGIVSATGREGLDPNAYEDFIQTDAAINPGNSGGPLVNVHGEVIGINTAIISRSGGYQGIGFAVPSHMVRDVMDQILERGRVVRGWLGVSIQPVSPSVAETFDLSEASGALVGHVEDDSPAAAAGLEVGDVITAIDGRKVADVSDVRFRVAQAGPDTPVTLTVIRDGGERDLPVTLGELVDLQAGTAGDVGSGALEGVAVQSLHPPLRRQLGVPAETQGVLVSAVDPTSAAARAGLQRGDVIEEVNRQTVTTVAEFERAARAGDESVVLLVNRDGRTRYVVVG